MALALYRKYRPATFAEVVGQEHVTEPLRTALAAGRINHAYLFSGPRGCGKTSSARILARSLNCVQGPTPDPCGICPSCIALAPEGPGSLDVVELDAASHGGVDDTRDLRDKAFYMPAESRYRVFIIDEAHMVTTQGFNALLKIVEEPPEHLVFIFATTEPDKVLTTIRSRTHHYPFRLIAPTTLRTLLERLCGEEGVLVEPAVFPLVIRAGGGSARDSLSVLDQLLAGAGPEGVTYRSAVALLGVTDAALLDEVVDALAAADGASVFGAVDRVVEAGHDPRRFAADLLQRFRDLVIINAVPEAAAKGLIDTPEDQLATMQGQADRLGIATLTRLAEVMHTGLVDMRGTTAPRLVLELLCARMLLPAASESDAAMLQRLERMERRMDIAGELPSTGDAAARPVGRVTPEPEADTREAPVAPFRRPAAVSDGAAQAPSVSQPAGPGSGGSAVGPATKPVRTAPDLGLPQRPRLSSQSSDGRSSSQPPPPAERAETPSGTRRTPEPAPSSGGREAVGRDGNRSSPDNVSAATGSVEPASSSVIKAPSPTAASTIGVTDVRRVWPEVLTAVQRQRRTTQILLESATVVGVDAGALTVAMPSAGMARRVLEPANADLLRAALKQVLGVDWMIKCEVAGAGPAAATRGAPTGSNGGPPSPPMNQARPEVVPPPPEAPDDDIPDDYGEPPDPDAPAAVVQDPEEAAIALLSTELGARRLDPPA